MIPGVPEAIHWWNSTLSPCTYLCKSELISRWCAPFDMNVNPGRICGLQKTLTTSYPGNWRGKKSTCHHIILNLSEWLIRCHAWFVSSVQTWSVITGCFAPDRVLMVTAKYLYAKLSQRLTFNGHTWEWCRSQTISNTFCKKLVEYIHKNVSTCADLFAFCWSALTFGFCCAAHSTATLCVRREVENMMDETTL